MSADKRCSLCDHCTITNNVTTGIDAKCKQFDTELKHVVLWVAFTNGEGGETAPEPMMDCLFYIPRKEKECKNCVSAMTIYGDELHINVLFHICTRRHVIIGNTLDGKKCVII